MESIKTANEEVKKQLSAELKSLSQISIRESQNENPTKPNQVNYIPIGTTKILNDDQIKEIQEYIVSRLSEVDAKTS